MPYKAPEVNADAFTIFDTPYAGALGALAQQQGPRGYLSMAALGNRVGAGQGNYLSALQGANANQLQGSHNENQMEMAKAYLGQIAPMATAGVLGGVQLPDNPYIGGLNIPLADANNVIVQDGRVAGAQKDRAGVLTDMAGIGQFPGSPQASMYLRPPIPSANGEYVEYQGGYITPKDQAEIEIAQQNADSNTVRANKPSGGGGDGDGDFTYSLTVENPDNPGRKLTIKGDRMPEGFGGPGGTASAATGPNPPYKAPPGKVWKRRPGGHWGLENKGKK